MQLQWNKSWRLFLSPTTTAACDSGQRPLRNCCGGQRGQRLAHMRLLWQLPRAQRKIDCLRVSQGWELLGSSPLPPTGRGAISCYILTREEVGKFVGGWVCNKWEDAVPVAQVSLPALLSFEPQLAYTAYTWTLRPHGHTDKLGAR